MENSTDCRRECLELMEISEAVYLTTMDSEGFPFTRAMLNLRNRKQYPGLIPFFSDSSDKFIVYFSTNTSSVKMQQIESNPIVSVYYCRPGSFHGVMLSGKMEIVTDRKTKAGLWQEGWTGYYPGGVDDPDNSVLRLSPDLVRGWSHGEAFEFRPGAEG